MILPLALSTSKIAEMQVHTGTYPGSGIEFNGKDYILFKVESVVVVEWVIW